MQNINFNNEMTKNKKEFQMYFSSSKQLQPALTLKKLSDDHLLSQTKTLVQKERKLNVKILQHLQEIESRKLYLERGFSSLFDYTVKELGYGEGAAYRRIKTMKLCQDIPETKTQIESGQLTLSTASQLQNFFEKQKRKSNINLKNQSITVPNNTKSNSRSSVQQVLRNVSSLRRNSALSKENHDLNLCFSKEKSSLKNIENTGCSSEEVIQNNSFASLDQKKNLINKTLGKSQAKTQKLLSEVDPEVFQQKEKTRSIGNQKVELKVILDEDCFKNLETLKNLLSHKNPRMSYGELINLLAELGLKKYDPRKKLNQKPTKKQKNQKTLCSVNLLKTEQNKSKPKKNNRSIPQKIKQYIWKRDQGECSYVCLKTKNKCRSKHLLQIDHIQPFALGGSHHPDNLRLLCARHNQYRSQRTFDFKL